MCVSEIEIVTVVMRSALFLEYRVIYYIITAVSFILLFES